ncbi:DNA polymerase III subunit gamma/tau [Aureimonas fodinaquatilis]|uniref:DNA polymerase III subunit gamma/tau n=1 Tax=Aureimonas fodinaquatilis TaxID=2565783 RepID=A0A5B0E218_9HYPH|nr:DNA polymerase III subunit gamma/tau [Aureimonas fodinaquatilis]KAA0972342.1 DNA polymerase III subunit gamma/tau [Aureimonas fodinaquatilis]
MQATDDKGQGGLVPYRVLARKYRPQSFEDLIGQEPMVQTLTNAFEVGRIAQAWMLTGVRGVGKTTTARILARALNYETDTIHRPSIHLEQPGLHDQAIMEGRHVDVVEMDAASHTGIEDIREIIAQVRYRPVSARYKVYIIDEVHMLSTQAFNGLLKTLEEPPEHVKFVFATTEIRKVPITVLSRCQRFDLRRVEAGEMIRHLRKILNAENVEADDDALRLLARASEGSVRDALSLTDQAIAHGAGVVSLQTVRDMLGLADRARIIDLFEMLMRGEVTASLTELRAQYNAGADPLVVLADLADFTHLVTSLRFVPESAEDGTLAPDEAERGRALASSLSVRTLSQVWQMLLKAVEETRMAASPRQAAEMALIRIAHASTLPSPDDLLRILQQGGNVALPQPPATPTTPASSGAPAGTSAPPPAVSVGTEAPASGGQMAAPRALGGRGALGIHLVAHEVQPTPSAQANALPEVALGSLEDLDALAEKMRDSRMRLWIRRYLRPVKIEAGRLEIGFADGAPPSLAGDLHRKLLEWTGRRWTVSVATAQVESPTLEEKAEKRREALFAEANADPDVALLLKAFPGARVAHVRLRDDAAEKEPDDVPVDEAEAKDIDMGDAFDETGSLDNISNDDDLPVYTDPDSEDEED